MHRNDPPIETQHFKTLPNLQFTYIGPGQQVPVYALKTDRTRKVEYYNTPVQPKVDTLFIQIEDRAIKSGEILTVPVRVKNFKNIIAFQFGLGIDKNSLSIMGLDPINLSNHTFSQNNLTNGRVNLIWFQFSSVTMEDHSSQYNIQLKATKNGKISQLIQLDNTILPLEAVRKGYEFLHIELVVTDPKLDGDIGTEDPCPVDPDNGENITKENPISASRIHDPAPSIKTDEFSHNVPLTVTTWPVPFTDQIMLGFELPVNVSVSLYILDAFGKVTYHWNGSFQKGANRIALSGAYFNGKGLYYYKLETPFQSSVGAIMKE